MGVGGSAWDAGDVATEGRMNQKMTLIDTGTNISAFASPQNGMQAFATDTSSVFVGANWYYYNGAWFPRQGFRGSGAQIAALITNGMAYQGLLAYCTSTGSGYVIDHVYFYDGSAFRDTNELINPIMKMVNRQHYYFNNTTNLLASASGSAAIANAGGGIKLTTNASGDDSLFTYGSATPALGFRRDRKWELHFLVIPEDTPGDFQYEFGLSDDITGTLSGDNDDFAVFYLDTGSNNWHTRCNDNGATAPAGIDTGTAVAANTPYLLSLINDESAITFWINGVLEATWSTDLPTASTTLYVKGFQSGAAATTRETVVRYWELWADTA